MTVFRCVRCNQPLATPLKQLATFSAIGRSDARDGMGALSDAMAGIVVMVLVLLCPYATYKFVHRASDGGGHDDLHRTGVAGMAVAAGAAKTAGSLAMQTGTGTLAPQGPSQVPGMGKDGVAPGVSPTGGNLSKEGIDAGPPKPQTSFRYGEDPKASGDKGQSLVQRPGIAALITRPVAEAVNSGEGTPTTGGGSTVQPSGPARRPTTVIAYTG